jgi:hypothetical protein
MNLVQWFQRWMRRRKARRMLAESERLARWLADERRYYELSLALMRANWPGDDKPSA